MGVLDFLWQGQPPAAVNTYGVSTQNIPQYMSDYVQGLLNRANAVASEPFQQYDAPRIAGFTPDQQAAFQATRNMQGQWTPFMQSATNFATSSGSVNPLANASPMIGQAAGMDSVGAASPFLNNAANMSGSAAASPFVSQASSMNPLGMASPFFSAASSINPLDQAAPFANNASGTFTGANVQNYMNPFIQNVVDRAGTMASRNLSERLIPAIGDQFIKAGQFGSSRMQGEIGKALRDTNDSMTEQIGTLLSQGYGQAGQMFGQDMGRQAQLAGTMGGLGSNYMQGLAGIGSNMGNLANAQMGQLGNLGQLMGNLTNQQANTMANVGQTFGNLTNAQMGQYGNLAQLIGNMSNMYAGNQRDAASLMSNLGTQTQAAGLRDAAALEGVGQTQQQLDQRNADMAYQDFVQQRDYPQTMVNFMNSIVRGLPMSSTSSTTYNAPGTNFQPSPLAQIAGSLSLLGGLSNLRFKKGGHVRKPPARGALSMVGA